MSEETAILEVRGLSKRFPVGGAFGRRWVYALTSASFSIGRGRVVSLVGESGCGKSTTARLLARLEQPSAGEILLDGSNVLESEPRTASTSYRGRVQMIFQDPFGSLNPVKRVGHHIERPLRIHGKTRSAEVKERVVELLETVGLAPAADVAERYPHELSGGQRQRVAIARALAVEPDVILADEPISMLDVSIRMGVLNLIERLKSERGIGFLYITHDLASARYIGDTTIVMYAGHMVEGAPSDELVDAPFHPYTRLLLAAVPNPRATHAAGTTKAAREVPSQLEPGKGCPFATRCPSAMAVCRERIPEPTVAAPHHWVRCHLFTPNHNDELTTKER